MKTFSIILIVFTLGFFGWLDFENEEIPKKIKQNDTDLKIIRAENHCAKLELKIQEKQKEIQEKR